MLQIAVDARASARLFRLISNRGERVHLNAFEVIFIKYFQKFESFKNKLPFIFSIDKIILSGSLNHDSIDHVFKEIHRLDYSHTDIWAKANMEPFFIPSGLYLYSYQYYESRKNMSYRHCFDFEIVDYVQSAKGERASFWLGIGLNKFGKVDNETWKLEFNPNKVLPCDFCSDLFGVLMCNSYWVDLKEYDIAVDVPLQRDSFFLSVRNGCKYGLIQNSATNKTEYSGVRHKNGFTKLYNKQLEQKLDMPLTRIEFTFTTLDYIASCDSIPNIYYYDVLQFKLSDLALNDTERFILNTLLVAPNRVNELGRYMAQKMKAIISDYVYTFDLTREEFEQSMKILKSIPIVECGIHE